MDVGHRLGLAKPHCQKHRAKPELPLIEPLPGVDPAAANEVLVVAQILGGIVTGQVIDSRGFRKEATAPHLELLAEWKPRASLSLVLQPRVARPCSLIQTK